MIDWSAIDTVLLDMDGTLLDTEPLAARAWLDAASTLGVRFDEALLPAMVGRTCADCRALLVARLADTDAVDRLMRGWHAAYDAMVEREGLALKAGVTELFDWLDDADVPRAVATSTRRDRALAKLGSTGLASRLHAIVGGDEVARGKPAPDIFLEAAARLAVAPAECAVLEDSDAGVQGALAAGMTPIMIPDGGPRSQDLLRAYPLVMGSLHDALAHLKARILAPHPSSRRTIVR